MPLETQATTVPLSPAQAVDVDKIEKELAAMWSGASDVDSGAGITRACALNLIVYTTPWDDRDVLEDFLSQVNEQHPGRTLILVAHREESAPRLEAYVSMRCRLSGSSGKQICGEQVTIEAGGPLVETAATAVAPLLVPDVPVFLWWKDIPHYQDRLFDRLAQMSDRIVIDSAAFDHPSDDLLRLAEIIGDQARPIRISYLNWGRLTSWRTLLASFWDVAEYRPLLDRIDHISVSCRAPAVGNGEIAPAALLLVGWLASRLGWALSGNMRENNGVAECDLTCDNRVLTLSLAPDTTAAPPDGMVCSIAIGASDGAADFSVSLRANGTQLETKARIGAEHTVGRLLTYEM